MRGKSPEIDDNDPRRRKSSLDIEDDYEKEGGSQRNGATPNNDDREVKGSLDNKDGGRERRGSPDVHHDTMEQGRSANSDGGIGNRDSPGIEGREDSGH